MESECFNPEIKLLVAVSTKDLHTFWNMSRLSAPYWRLYWHDTEGAFVSFEGKRHALGPNRLMLIAPETDFSTSCPGHSRQYYIHFLAGPPYANIRSSVFEFPIKSQERQAFFKRAFDLSPPWTKERLTKSLVALQGVLFALELLPSELLNERRIDPRVAFAMDALRPFSSIKSNEKLAATAGMSTNAFLRLFREQTGATPQLYNRTRRIDEACLLLHHSHLDIKDIASQLGFCDRYHFSRVFKQVRGLSPAEFRRRQTGQESLPIIRKRAEPN